MTECAINELRGSVAYQPTGQRWWERNGTCWGMLGSLVPGDNDECLHLNITDFYVVHSFTYCLFSCLCLSSLILRIRHVLFSCAVCWTSTIALFICLSLGLSVCPSIHISAGLSVALSISYSRIPSAGLCSCVVLSPGSINSPSHLSGWPLVLFCWKCKHYSRVVTSHGMPHCLLLLTRHFSST